MLNYKIICVPSRLAIRTAPGKGITPSAAGLELSDDFHQNIDDA